MNVCLFSPVGAIVKIDGNAHFITKYNPMSFSTDRSFIEFLPQGYEPSFCFTSEREYSNNMRIIELYDGFLYIPRLKRKRDEPYKRIFMKTQSYYGEQICFKVVTDGGIKLTALSSMSENATELPFVPTDIQIVPHSDFPVVMVILKGKKNVAVAFKLPELEIVFKTVGDEIELGEYVTVKNSYCDIAGHTVTDFWKTGLPFKSEGRKITYRNKRFSDEIIPYAFLEEVAIKGDYRAFLSAELKERAELIPEFLGKTDYFVPPFCTSMNSRIILVCDRKAKYLSVKLVDGLISDINLE